MSTLQNPRNDWAKALFILIQNNIAGISMAKVLTHYDQTFYKFQTRIGDIEREHPKLKISHTMIPYTSKVDGKKKHYTQYTPISPYPYLINLYNSLNNNGLKSPKKS